MNDVHKSYFLILQLDWIYELWNSFLGSISYHKTITPVHFYCLIGLFVAILPSEKLSFNTYLQLHHIICTLSNNHTTVSTIHKQRKYVHLDNNQEQNSLLLIYDVKMYVQYNTHFNKIQLIIKQLHYQLFPMVYFIPPVHLVKLTKCYHFLKILYNLINVKGSNAI